MSNKTFWFDLETTGLDEKAHGIVELACEIQIGDEIAERRSWDIKPFKDDILDPKALKINGKTKEILETYPDPDIVFKEIITFLNKYIDRFDKTDKFYLAGYNVWKFDIPFLREFFLNNSCKYFGSYFRNNAADVMLDVMMRAYKDPNFNPKNFKLGTIAEYLNIVPSGDLHGGVVDVDLTRRIFENLVKMG